MFFCLFVCFILWGCVCVCAGYWSSEGCHTNVTESEVDCCCNHLSFFAVLVVNRAGNNNNYNNNNNNNNKNNKDFSVAEPSFISGKRPSCNTELRQLHRLRSVRPLYSLGFNPIFQTAVSAWSSWESYCTLMRTIKALSCRLRRPEKSVTVHLHLAGALLCLHLSFLLCGSWVLVLNENDEGWVCRGLGLLLHWSLLASFLWMALEGFHLYLLLVRVFNIYIKKYVLKLSLVAWGEEPGQIFSTYDFILFGIGLKSALALLSELLSALLFSLCRIPNGDGGDLWGFWCLR